MFIEEHCSQKELKAAGWRKKKSIFYSLALLKKDVCGCLGKKKQIVKI